MAPDMEGAAHPEMDGTHTSTHTATTAKWSDATVPDRESAASDYQRFRDHAVTDLLDAYEWGEPTEAQSEALAYAVLALAAAIRETTGGTR